VYDAVPQPLELELRDGPVTNRDATSSPDLTDIKETTLAQIYEGMFLLDNAVVREDWNTAKSIVTSTLEKHGGTIHTARRWDERRLSYPIKGKNRATFLLAYYEIPAENIPAMRRDFELNVSVLRSLELLVDAIPKGETELHSSETAEDFIVPTPPDDDHIEFVEEPERYYREDRRDSRDDRGDRGDRGGSDRGAPEGAKDDKGKEDKGKEAKAKEEPAKEEPASKGTDDAPAAATDDKTAEEAVKASEES